MPDEIPGKYGGILNPRQEGDPGIPGAGRKPGSLSAKTIIRKWLEAQEKAKNPVTGEQEQMTQLDIITLKQLEKARKGDTAAFRELLDRTEGKPMQSVGLDVNGSIGINWNETKNYGTDEKTD